MDSSTGPIVYRKRILTNPAAEFVEKRATWELLAQLTNSTEEAADLEKRTEFISEFDGFALKGKVFDPTAYYEESEKRLAKFRETLQAFVRLIKERNVESDLSIILKDPSDGAFTLDYALSVVARIDEGPPDTSTHAKTCKAFIRRCFKKVDNNKQIIDGILSMVPNDVYGSVISGAFTIILAAVEKHNEQREAIQKFLAEIPHKLEKMHRLSDIHCDSRRLHACIDGVIVAIFVVLERIVNKLTDTWTYKTKKKTATLKSIIKGRSKKSKNCSTDDTELREEGDAKDGTTLDQTTVADAIADLETQVQRFEEEVLICDKERLKRVEQDTGSTSHNVEAVVKDTKLMKDSLAWMIAKGLINPESDQSSRDEFQIRMLDMIYLFLASDPRLNPSSNAAPDLAQLPELEETKPEPPSPQVIRKQNRRIVKTWLSNLDDFKHDPISDMKDCLAHMERLDLDDKNISQSILTSEKLRDWFKSHESSILTISLPTPPSGLVNPTSVTAALLATALQSTRRFPVLSFFCGYRTNDSILSKDSGPLGLVKSLSAQLMGFIRDYRKEIDLSSLQEEKLLRAKSITDLTSSLTLLEAFISLLPEGDTAYIIIEGHSRMTGGEKKGNKVLKGLDKIIQRIGESRGLEIKVLITDPLVGSVVGDLADMELHVQDLGAGSGVFHVEDVKRITGDLEGKKKKRKRKTNAKRGNKETESD
ncbi:hypothetical protein QBC38DRAFT_486249 [Podospora fimiseda]|uniref:Fungal STAND N-terminal Goodbye domain-containing protein n=1 Tax=Podospora fimiseda TaxID=252190 RepID=A0AAN7GTB1_9PEZI|nr:hypothetical protein QBC38DRAFT_486249 [Podospora fimiseda]